MNELNILSANIGNGWVRSRSVNSRKISTIMMKQGIRRFIQMKGGKGLAFRVKESTSVGKSESSDDYQIYITRSCQTAVPAQSERR